MNLILKTELKYTFITLVVLLIAFINNVLIETIVFIIIFYFIKRIFKIQFHADYLTTNVQLAVNICLVITFIIQLGVVSVLHTFYISYFSNIIIAFVLGILSNIIGDYVLLKCSTDWTLTKIDLIICKYNLSEDDKRRMIYKFIDKRN